MFSDVFKRCFSFDFISKQYYLSHCGTFDYRFNKLLTQGYLLVSKPFYKTMTKTCQRDSYSILCQSVFQSIAKKQG